mmetsp:Transcript_24322/g.37494  ORF Transcript_24322/g.37494 Transcript_24322/m.37494 type:complete len:252 (+) Transcript_24322:1660-2415(+)
MNNLTATMGIYASMASTRSSSHPYRTSRLSSIFFACNGRTPSLTSSATCRRFSHVISTALRSTKFNKDSGICLSFASVLDWYDTIIKSPSFSASLSSVYRPSTSLHPPVLSYFRNTKPPSKSIRTTSSLSFVTVGGCANPSSTPTSSRHFMRTTISPSSAISSTPIALIIASRVCSGHGKSMVKAVTCETRPVWQILSQALTPILGSDQLGSHVVYSSLSLSTDKRGMNNDFSTTLSTRSDSCDWVSLSSI